MSRYKITKLTDFFKKAIHENLPNKTDNLRQFIIKIAFLVCIVGIFCGGIHFSVYYSNSAHEQKLIEKQQLFFKNNSLKNSTKYLYEQNNDYVAWLNIKGTSLNNAVYKTGNNSFYMTHNHLKKPSSYGALCLDYRFDLSDKNAVIYGANIQNGLMFGTLENLRELSFYKQNSVITLTHKNSKTNYKIYALFVLNSAKEQDNGKIYELYKKNFSSELSFNSWVEDAMTRSLIDTKVDVSFDDKILTLVTDCDDFEGARLVVMARSEREGETLSPINQHAVLNRNPRYPKKWYDVRNISYPFENFKTKD